MRTLAVYIEMNGQQNYVGQIKGNGPADACFIYADEYCAKSEAVSISLSLPISEKTFSPVQTQNFFEGLLPEGFTRRCVASWMNADENDYITILSGLGNECLGAIRYECNQDKYLQKAFELIRNYSANPMEDQLKLWDITVYNYLIGNTDNHIKNLSLLYSKNLKSIRLAPAYDIVSTTIYESSIKDMALSINGKYAIDTLKRTDFKEQAHQCGIGEKIAMDHFEKLASGFEQMLQNTADFMREEGFVNSEKLKEKILSSGGYHYL